MSRGMDIIDEVLAEHFGDAFVPEENWTNGNGRAPDEDDDSPYKRLNDHAMKNLSMWVMDLGIYKCRRRRGPHASYEAVAQWRRSTTYGDDIEKRLPNLKISPLGIKDFGDGRKYSPLDLVMAAKGCDLATAFDWLSEKTGFSIDGPEIDLGAIKAKKPPADNAKQKTEEPVDVGPDGRERIRPGKLLGDAWYFGDPVPEQAPMLVPFFVPARGFGYLGGQWGTFKTFILMTSPLPLLQEESSRANRSAGPV